MKIFAIILLGSMCSSFSCNNDSNQSSIVKSRKSSNSHEQDLLQNNVPQINNGEDSSNNNSDNLNSSTILLCSANVWSYSGSSLNTIMKHIYDSVKSKLHNIENIIIGFQEDICTSDVEKNIMSSLFKEESERIFKGYNLIIREQSKTGEGNYSNSMIILSKALKENNCEIVNLGENGLNTTSSSETPRSAIFANLSLSDSKSIKICNTHLFGGYIDDPKMSTSEINYNIKNEMMKKILEKEPNIIMGDFNSDKNGNENRLIGDYWGKNIKLKEKIGEGNAMEFLNSPHSLLQRENFISATIEVNSTTPFDIRPDWIYVNSKNDYKIIDSGVIETGAKKGIKTISDHDFIYTILEV